MYYLGEQTPHFTREHHEPIHHLRPAATTTTTASPNTANSFPLKSSPPKLHPAEFDTHLETASPYPAFRAHPPSGA